MKKVKIRLMNDQGTCLWLTINYFSVRGRKPRKHVDNFYLTEKAQFATAVPLTEARRWMREARNLASWDGDNIVKSEYMHGGKPTTLKALSL